MAAPSDPRARAIVPPRQVSVSAPDLCGWCFGAGTILEAMDCDVEHVYLPVVCAECAGTGHRQAA